MIRWTLILVALLSGLTNQAKAEISPADGATLETSLTATLRWDYPNVAAAHNWPASKQTLRISQHEDLSNPIISIDLPENRTTYRLAVVPQTTYFWQVTPFEGDKPRTAAIVHGKFTTAAPRIDTTEDDTIRYRNPREGAHWTEEKAVPFAQPEPLSPWFDRKAFSGQPLPTFEQIKSRLPVPIYDGHADALDAYWYCWKTLLGVWYFAPDAVDHEAVDNICGIKAWGVWGSTMVFDTSFILHFARYGNGAYPFVTAFDNCYARQHDNGFICRESDKNNREVFSGFPVNPPLFAWAEWEWYRATGDRARLAAVFLPIVKHYEWFMTYQRRENGLYWTNGLQEADDSPRNALMHAAVSATSYQALASRCLAMMAHTIGRDDLAPFFEAEHEKLANLVNENFWDEKHGIYNDLDAKGNFITELTPGSFCKHVHMFWPLLAGVAPADRVDKMLAELNNPASFNRRNGVPSLSADSAGYTGGPTGNGQYWRGAVWPSGECMVQEALRASGKEDAARALAEKYWHAQVEVFTKEKTIRENMAPDQAIGCGMGEFVGWGGIGPVANLIEAVIGLDIDAPAKTITWRIDKLERHGLTNFTFGGTAVDLICAERKSANDPCQIDVKSGAAFTLKIVANGQTKTESIAAGEHHLTLP